jgi:hypothetical protein
MGKLRPGMMGLSIGNGGGTGIPGDFDNSLASQIENELNSILGGEGRDTFDTNDNSSDARDRRMLFVAIARGVVAHLVANPDAFKLNLTKDGDGKVTNVTLTIEQVQA